MSQNHDHRRKLITLASVIALTAVAFAGLYFLRKAPDTGRSGTVEATAPQAMAKKSEVTAQGTASTQVAHAPAAAQGAPAAQLLSDQTGVARLGNSLSAQPSSAQSNPAQSAPAAAAKPAETDGCFVQKFRHQKLATHSDGEECLKHRNLIRLSNVQPSKISGVCVRVNGAPVKFSRASGKAEILIGAEAGPDAEITVRYCLGKAKCAEDCSVKHDEFLAAISGDRGEGSGWDSSAEGKQQDAALESEMAALNKDMGGTSVENGVFSGWERTDAIAQHSCQAPARTVAHAK